MEKASSAATSSRPILVASLTSAEIELQSMTSELDSKKTSKKLTETELTAVSDSDTVETDTLTMPEEDKAQNDTSPTMPGTDTAQNDTSPSPQPSPSPTTTKTVAPSQTPSVSSAQTKKSKSSSRPTTTDTTTPVPATTSARSSVTFAPEPPRTTATSSPTTEPPTSEWQSSSTAKEPKRWNAVAEANANKGFFTRLKRTMGCGSSLDAMYDDPMPVVVFGATGLVGGAVARALLRDRRFEVKAVTRSPTTDVSRKLAEEGAIIVTADLNDPRSLTRAIDGAHAVFLVTHYWEHMNREKEITQGKNCVDAAVAASVAHFVFYGSESPKDALGVECGYMDAKAVIENYVKNTMLPYTALRLPFYFENFLGVFKPHKVRNGVFAVALPMEDKPMDCISVRDVGLCVVNVLLRPKAYLCRVLPVTAEKLTVQQITDSFNKHFSDRKFICPRVRVKDYEQFGFDGAKDIAAMFEFYQRGQEPRDIKSTRRIQGSLLSFDRWLAENKQKLAESMNITE